MNKNKEKTTFQLVWGIALLLAGLGVFYRIPQVMPKVAQIELFASVLPFVQACFWLMGIILAGGGLKKIYLHFKKPKEYADESGQRG